MAYETDTHTSDRDFPEDIKKCCPKCEDKIEAPMDFVPVAKADDCDLCGCCDDAVTEEK